MLEIIYSPTFIRLFNKLEYGLQEEVELKIELFKDKRNRKQLKVHKLKGRLANKYSFSVNYKVRIVFQNLSKTKVEFIVIGSHDIYY